MRETIEGAIARINRYGSVIQALYLPADASWNLSTGTAAVGTAGGGRVQVWTLPNAATQQIQRTVRVPDRWATYAVDYLWTNAGAGTGNVTFGLKTSDVVPGSTLAGGDVDNGNLTGYVAPAQDVLTQSVIKTGLVVPASRFLNLRVLRRTTSDTLGNSIALVGVLLRVTSTS